MREKKDKLKAFGKTLFPFLAGFASILACITSDFVQNSFQKSWGWLKEAPAVNNAITVLVLTGITIPIAYLIVYGSKVLLPRIACALNNACSKHKRHIVQAIKHTIPDELFNKKDRAVRQMIAEVLLTHSRSSGKVFAVSERYGAKLLPANFAVYADCVGDIFILARRLVDKKFVERIEFFTFFKKPVQAWYNPYSAKLFCGSRVASECHFTRSGWEKYKDETRFLKDGKSALSVLRLLIPQRPDETATHYLYYPSDAGKALSVKDGRNFTSDKFLVDKQNLPLDLLKEIVNTLSVERDQDMLVHLVGTLRRDVKASRCVSLVKHFEGVYHTGSIDIRGKSIDRFKAGVFFGYVNNEMPDFAECVDFYDDIFAVRITCRKGLTRNFALAFVKDVIRGVSGIYFMQDDEISRFIKVFCSQWFHAVSSFPEKEAKTGYTKGNIIIPS